MRIFRTPDRLFKGYIFDLDGTLYLGNNLLPGADQTLTDLRLAGCRIAFVSNNPTHTREFIVAKLNNLGVVADDSEIVLSSHVLVDYLTKRCPGCSVFPVGEQPLHDVLIAGGFEIQYDPKRIDFVIASFDRNFNYSKLQIAFDAIRAGARLIATNADRYCPVEGGGQPDAASVIAAIEACTNTKNEIVVGKPSIIMAQTILDMLDLPPEQVLICGDRLETDILMGKQSGITTALVLTGVTLPEHIYPDSIQPDYILQSIDQLVRQRATSS
jgi:HAD superfamily hydrolase (TIGR01450 family)